MDGATLQKRIYTGYAKAASRIGLQTDQYRPTSVSNPLALQNRLGTFPASFNAEDMNYSKPNKYGHPTWFGLFDGSLTKVGDYLTNASDGTFFIAAQQQALPILVVQCNRTINVIRPQQQAGVGALGYGGTTPTNETTIMTAWPASVLQGTKGEKGDAILPGDVRSPWWAILLPYYSVNIRAADIITDETSRRYVVSSAERTDLGWRITAMQAVT